MINDAKKAYRTQKYNDAIELFLEILQQYPEDVEVLEGLAKSYFRLKKKDKALEICSQALSINASIAWPHTVRSYIYFPQKLDECKKEAKIAMEIAPTNWETNFWWGSIWCYENKLDDGIGFLERAAAIEPDEWAVYNNLATAYFKKKYYQKYYWALAEMNRLRPSLFLSYMIIFGKLFKLNTRA